MSETPELTASKQGKTLGDHLKALGGAAMIVLFTLVLIEILLGALDPWRLSYFNDLERMGNDIFTIDAERGFYMPDDQYQFSYWQTTIEDGVRRVPDTNFDADCEIIILGDSVAHGFGVDDNETWVNLIARDLPDVHLINTAVPRYNSTNVLGNLRAYPDGDAYLYLIIQNDIDPAINPATDVYIGSASSQPQLVRYVSFWLRSDKPNFVPDDAPDDGEFPEALLAQYRNDPRVLRLIDEVGQIAADERVTLAAFGHEWLTAILLEQGFDLTVLAYPPHRISFADYHLNAQGNIELANQMLPVVKQMSEDHCET